MLLAPDFFGTFLVAPIARAFFINFAIASFSLDLLSCLDLAASGSLPLALGQITDSAVKTLL